MKKQVISTKNAPAAIGPYSQAVIGGNTLYVSGQLPIDPKTGIIPETIEEQVEQSMKNVISLIEAADSSIDGILKCGLFVKDMSLFPVINEIYAKFFDNEPPARFVVEVSRLPKDVQIEIDAIALV